MTDVASPEQPSAPVVKTSRSRGAALMVAAGIFASRIFGLLRQMVFAGFFGQQDAADALNASLRIPNFLQNLFGEGTLSASFIPEYVKLRAEGKDREAVELAGAVLGILTAVVTILVALGVLATPLIADLLLPKWSESRRDLAIILIRVMFPGVGLLVLSAWCLGVLNSHRKFFLSYASPVLWNIAIIVATLIPGRAMDPNQRVVWVAWGAAIGSALQLLVQVPLALRLTRPLRPHVRPWSPATRNVLRNFGPAFLSRGVVQISGVIDTVIAGAISLGALTAVANAQTLYLLPISLFGMSIAASELPALSETSLGVNRSEALRARIATATRNVAFFIIPTLVVFVLFGREVVRVIFELGRFKAEDTAWVAATLAGASIGLLPQATGRALSSAHYALGDTRVPLRCAVVRVILSTSLGFFGAFYLAPWLGTAFDLTPWLGLDPVQLGTVALTVAGGLAAAVEFGLLRVALRRKIGPWRVARADLLKIWLASGAGALAAWGASGLFAGRIPGRPAAIVTLGTFGITYLAVAVAQGMAIPGRRRTKMS